MIDPDHYQKLADAGLNVEQIGVVMRILAEREASFNAADEARKKVVRDRVQRWRDKRNVTVTLPERNGDATERLTRGDARGEDNLLPKKITGQEERKKLLVHSHRERDFFAEFWTAYPNREGPNPKKPAKLAFDRLVAKGADPEKLIASAVDLAKQHPSPTRFIPQAVTFLNQERHEDATPVMTGDEFCPDDWQNTRFLVIRYRNEHSGADPPRAIHGGKSGFMIPAEWVQLSKQLKVSSA